MLKIDDLDVYFVHDKSEWGFSMSMVGNGRTVDTPYTGVTVCRISRGDDLVAEGYAFCAVGDKFEKAKGRKVSLARALRGFNKDFRSRVWSLYFSTVKKM